jgi:membrane protease YdiL (CAAX protease family)
MTDSVPPQTLDYSPPPPPERKIAPLIISWVVIWLCVAFLMLSSIMPSIRGRKQSANSVATDSQIELQVRYAIGVQKLLPTQVPVIEELEKTARGPNGKLEIAIAAGELNGPEAALKRLDELQRDTSTEDSLRQDITDLRTIYADGPGALDETARQRLIDRHGFFGKLALAYKQPDTNPNRIEVEQRGRKTAITLFIALGIIALLGLAGIVLLVIGIIMLATGSTHLAFRPVPSDSVYLEMFAVYLSSFILMSIAVTLLSGGSPSLAISWLLSAVLPLAIGWGILRGLSFTEMRQALGWHTGRGMHIELPLGIAGYIGGIPIVVIGFLITYLLLWLTQLMPTHPIQNELVGSRWDAIQLYLIACVWAPVMEETMFRGALFNHLRQRWSWVISAALVAFIFAAIHPQGWTFIPVLGSIAIVLAGLREWRGSILPSMVAHACNNFMMVSLLLSLK